MKSFFYEHQFWSKARQEFCVFDGTIHADNYNEAKAKLQILVNECANRNPQMDFINPHSLLREINYEVCNAKIT